MPLFRGETPRPHTLRRLCIIEASPLPHALETPHMRTSILLFFCLCSLPWTGNAGEPVRVLAEGTLPDDVRLEPLKDLNGYFPFTPPTDRQAWEQRAEYVRRQILVSQGLWPMPSKTPLNVVRHGQVERDEYTIEKVYFESVPGFYVTGNLYRPRHVQGKVPGVLFAHGHWQDARLSQESEAKLRQEIATGEERFERGGRSRFQSMCVQLARMGCVVWQWDMLSDSDALQLSREVVHTFAKQRPEMNRTERWGLYSPQAEAHLQSIMGLQTLNAVRSLDFLLSLPEVDPERTAITGASGGGTQTMLLAAIDPRIKLSFPAVMVSTSMQGGCTCENASLLRVNTGNIEFASLFAPKPQGMTTANDWTKEMSTKGFPEIKKLYELYQAGDKVMLQRGEHFPHNYNAVSRSAFFTWLNKHFKLGHPSPVIERDFEPLTREELTVWDAQHPAPKAKGDEFEKDLLQWLDQDATKTLLASAESLEGWQKTITPAIEVLIGRTFAAAGESKWELKHKQSHDTFVTMDGLIKNDTYQESLPVIWLYPKQWNGRVVLWLGARGKSSLFDSTGNLQSEVKQLVDHGATVLGADLLMQGEFLKPGETFQETPVVKNPREFAGYTFGYNHAIFAHRVHDVMTLVRYLQTAKVGSHPQASQIDLVALEDTGTIALAARALCGNAIHHAAVDTLGFRFGQLTNYRDPQFLPGGAKYLDVPGLIGLNAPHPLWIAGENALPELSNKAYSLHASTIKPVVYEGNSNGIREAVVRWLLR